MREPQNRLLLSKILVATDLSTRAEKAIARAVQLADEHRATLTILHVLPDAVGDEASKRQIILQVEKSLRRKVIKLSPHRETTVSIQVADGHGLCRDHSSGARESSRHHSRGRPRRAIHQQVAVRYDGGKNSAQRRSSSTARRTAGSWPLPNCPGADGFLRPIRRSAGACHADSARREISCPSRVSRK